MDPLVDKIMIAAAFISLVPLRAIPASEHLNLAHAERASAIEKDFDCVRCG